VFVHGRAVEVRWREEAWSVQIGSGCCTKCRNHVPAQNIATAVNNDHSGGSCRGWPGAATQRYRLAVYLLLEE
jgi:hypothetical protein